MHVKKIHLNGLFFMPFIILTKWLILMNDHKLYFILFLSIFRFTVSSDVNNDLIIYIFYVIIWILVQIRDLFYLFRMWTKIKRNSNKSFLFRFDSPLSTDRWLHYFYWVNKSNWTQSLNLKKYDFGKYSSLLSNTPINCLQLFCFLFLFLSKCTLISHIEYKSSFDMQWQRTTG